MIVKEFILLRSVQVLRLGLVAGFAVCVPAVLADDQYTETVQNATGSSQSQLNVVLAGNVSSSQIDGTLNPFGAGGSVNESYDSVNNETTVSFSGGSAVANGASVNVGWSVTQLDQVVSKYWGSVQSAPPTSLQVQVPSISVISSGVGTAPSFFDVFVTIGGGPTDLIQIPIMIGRGQRVIISNPGDNSEYLFDAGFMFSNTEIPLDNLNLGEFPASDFTPLPGFEPDSVLSPGALFDSEDIATPEPSTLTLLGGALAGLALWRRRKVA